MRKPRKVWVYNWAKKYRIGKFHLCDSIMLYIVEVKYIWLPFFWFWAGALHETTYSAERELAQKLGINFDDL